MGFKQDVLNDINRRLANIGEYVRAIDPSSTHFAKWSGAYDALRDLKERIQEMPEPTVDKLNNVKLYDDHIVWKRPIGEGYHVRDMIPLDQLMKENET